MSISGVIFHYKEKQTVIFCLEQEKMKEICQRYASQEKININKIYFFYNGNKINEELKFWEQINKLDKKRNIMNLLVQELEEDYSKIKNIKLDNNPIYEYIKKINYKFVHSPNLRYKLDITKSNSYYGWNDIFEVFISYKDNKEYLISPNFNNYNLDIFTILDNKQILSLKGHKNLIRTIRYFFNIKNNNEFLISADDNYIVIIWDISNNYNIKYQINTKYKNNIYSCLLIFPHISEDNYIITSTLNKQSIEDSATKIYSLNNGNFIRYIPGSNANHIFYLLSWYKQNNNKYYIIQFSYKKIIINNLLGNTLYAELKHLDEARYFSGFIYKKDNNDFLCSSSDIGYIDIWDLNNKYMINYINTYNCKFAHIIQWNDRYTIVADYSNKSFKIIDLDKNKVVSNIIGENTEKISCIKKIYHPIYGESLLSAADDKSIKLWVIQILSIINIFKY